MLTIQRITVRAALDDPTRALERAHDDAGAGDESWEDWVKRYERGEAIVLRLDVVLEADDGLHRTLRSVTDAVFIEATPHPPTVERQVADVVWSDFSKITRDLSQLGHELGDDLCDMYVHVELAEEVRSALQAPR